MSMKSGLFKFCKDFYLRAFNEMVIFLKSQEMRNQRLAKISTSKVGEGNQTPQGFLLVLFSFHFPSF